MVVLGFVDVVIGGAYGVAKVSMDQAELRINKSIAIIDERVGNLHNDVRT